MSRSLPVTRTDHTAAGLRLLAGKCQDAAQVRRLLALACVLEGWPRGEAAAQNGMDRQTLCDWVRRYNDAGVAGLKSQVSAGRAHALTGAQMAELRALVIEGPDPDVHQVVRWRCVDLRAEVAPLCRDGAREHDWQMAEPVAPDPAAAASVPSEEGCGGRAGF